MSGNYENLEVWNRGIDLSVRIYALTKQFPQEEIYGLTSQIRRAAFSVPSNIAEGSQRNSDKEFARFIGIALGSNAELKTQLIISYKINLISEIEYKSLVNETEEIAKMLNGLKNKLGASSYKLEAKS